MAPKKKRFEFKILAPEAKQVMLSGNFNGWSDTADPMTRDKTGGWKKIKVLTPGTYEYKFIVDGVWTVDPECADTVPNECGTHNSIIEL